MQELSSIRERIIDELRAEGVDVEAALAVEDARDLQVRCTERWLKVLSSAERACSLAVECCPWVSLGGTACETGKFRV